MNYRDLPISHLGVTVNYPMEVGGESPGGQTASNGATCAGPRCLAASSLPALLVIHTASCCCAVLTTELQLLLTPGLLVGVRRQIAGTHSTHAARGHGLPSRWRTPPRWGLPAAARLGHARLCVSAMPGTTRLRGQYKCCNL